MISLRMDSDTKRGTTLWLVTDAEEKAARRVGTKLVLDLNGADQLLACQVMSAWATELLHLRRATALLDPEPPPEDPDARCSMGAILRVLPHGESLVVNLRRHRPSEATEHVKVPEAELILDAEDRLVGITIPHREDFNPAKAILGLGHQMA